MNEYYQDLLLSALKNRGHSEAEIKKMSWQKKFDEYCEWEGLLGYGETLRKVYQAARGPANKPS